MGGLAPRPHLHLPALAALNPGSNASVEFRDSPTTKVTEKTELWMGRGGEQEAKSGLGGRGSDPAMAKTTTSRH